MENKLITLRGKEILLGANLGAFGVGKGHFICVKETDRIKAYYIIGVARTNEAAKEIAMQWGEVELASTELKPLPEYYDSDNNSLVVTSRATSYPSVSQGKIEVAPGYFMYSYDVFYGIMGTDKAGIVLYGIAMDRFFKEQFGVNILKIAANGFSFIQPVTFDVTYIIPYTVEVSVIDGVAPFTYSKDKTTWIESNTLSYSEEEVKTVYVKDSVGTISSLELNNSSWN